MGVRMGEWDVLTEVLEDDLEDLEELERSLKANGVGWGLAFLSKDHPSCEWNRHFKRYGTKREHFEATDVFCNVDLLERCQEMQEKEAGPPKAIAEVEVEKAPEEEEKPGKEEDNERNEKRHEKRDEDRRDRRDEDRRDRRDEKRDRRERDDDRRERRDRRDDEKTGKRKDRDDREERREKKDKKEKKEKDDEKKAKKTKYAWLLEFDSNSNDITQNVHEVSWSTKYQTHPILLETIRMVDDFIPQPILESHVVIRGQQGRRRKSRRPCKERQGEGNKMWSLLVG